MCVCVYVEGIAPGQMRERWKEGTKEGKKAYEGRKGRRKEYEERNVKEEKMGREELAFINIHVVAHRYIYTFLPSFL